MRKRLRIIYTVLYALIVVLTTVSCDEHIEWADTSTQIGDILCTDGSTVRLSELKSSGKTAIAVVFYVNHDSSVEGNGYAVYLDDIQESSFADTVGSSQGTSADLTAYDGNSNTYSMYTCSDVSSKLAQRVYDMWAYGQSVYIASVQQMRLLYSARSTINPILEEIGGTALPDAADECWYWTSTEVSGQEDYKAWLYSFGSGALQETPKDQTHKTRPILTMNN